MSSQARTGPYGLPNSLPNGNIAPTLNGGNPADRPSNDSPRQPPNTPNVPFKNWERVNEPTSNGDGGLNGFVNHEEPAVNGNQGSVVNGYSQESTANGAEQEFTISGDDQEQERVVNGNYQTQATINGGYETLRVNGASPDPAINGGHAHPALNGSQGGSIYNNSQQEATISVATTNSPEPVGNSHAHVQVNGGGPEPMMDNNGQRHANNDHDEPMTNGCHQGHAVNGHEDSGDSVSSPEPVINSSEQPHVNGVNGINGNHGDPMDLDTNSPSSSSNRTSQQGQQQLNDHNGDGRAQSPRINGFDGPSSSPPSVDGQNNTHTASRSDPRGARDPPVDPPRHTATTDLRGLFVAEKKKLTEKKDKIKGKNPPGGYDPTPLPDAPQGYTLMFTFHKAYNLPIADLKTYAADPFLHTTLTAAVPKRHKEDPPLTRRTPTIRKSTEPVWEDEWTVANIPSTGFTLKCRLYDEDWPDHDDRLGNVTIKIPQVDENWEGFDGQVFEVRKRSGSKRAYFFRAVSKLFCHTDSMTPRLHISIQVIGKSDPPHAQMYTVGPATWVKHFSPMIGRLAGTKVNKNDDDDAGSVAEGSTDRQANDRQTKKYDFQANEIQLSGPVPPNLYHRYVEFRPMIGRMFSSRGLRGRILNKALHKQHARVYNYDSTTEHGAYKPCSEEASLQFLKMAHFDEGGRIFTYVITLDGMMRFTETGKEFGVDLLSKHTMHSDVATYIACAGEFFIRRLAHADASDSPHPHEATHPPDDEITSGPPKLPPPHNPRHYQLIIDNDSGTYRPDQSVLPDLKKFLEKNFEGLGIVVMHCADDELTAMKKEQVEEKKKGGNARVRMVLNRSPSASNFSSDDESRLGEIERAGDLPFRSKKETVFDIIQNPSRWREYFGRGKPSTGESSSAGGGVLAASDATTVGDEANTVMADGANAGESKASPGTEDRGGDSASGAAAQATA